ncbi:MAG: hypothetical protein HRT35_37250, partial [Algicola sp.]|nr:hypothetical protein [Algicola sp.]
MSTTLDLLDILQSRGIKLSVDSDENLKIRGSKENLTTELIGLIKKTKAELIQILKSGQPGSEQITPQMLPLVSLSEEDIKHIVSQVA